MFDSDKEKYLRPVEKAGKYGYIDNFGVFVIKPQFDDANDFNEGLARVNVGGSDNGYGTIIGGKWGYIDKNGKFIIEPSFSYFLIDLGNGLGKPGTSSLQRIVMNISSTDYTVHVIDITIPASLKDGVWYDLQGRKYVEKPIQHGNTYIVSCGEFAQNIGSLSM